MKTLFSLTILALIVSCGSHEDTTKKDYAAERVNLRYLVVKDKAPMPKIELNESEQNGLLPDYSIMGDTLGYQYYVNGQKHGPYFDARIDKLEKRMEDGASDGYYQNGKKHGYFQRYLSPYRTHYISYYEEGEFIWAGYYGMEDMMGVYPVKPFHLNTSKEVVEVEAPHRNGKTWFKGKYVNGHPVGVHRLYDAQGHKLGKIDYRDSSIVEYWDGDSDTFSFAGDELWFGDNYPN